MGKAAGALAVGSQPLLATDYAAISWTDGLLNAATFAVEAWTALWILTRSEVSSLRRLRAHS